MHSVLVSDRYVLMNGFFLLQTDLDNNGVGDRCEGDLDDDNIVDFKDNCPNNSKIYATDFR